mmetsp:Transcript_46090/g.52030  ORF Transcript_46090/g.52030 Transcript_46090/m.52030 type:complete len:504 (+) Transcript_46090:149-1660(+)
MNFNNDDDEDDALKEAQEEEYYAEDDEGGGGGTGMVIKALALAVCLLILGICFYFSWSSQEAKRKAEVARIQAMREARLEGIEQKATEEDTKRLSITQAMQGRGMSITEMATGDGAAAAASMVNATAAAVAAANAAAAESAAYNVFDDLDDGDDDDSDISIEPEKDAANRTIPTGTNDNSTNKKTSPPGLYDDDDDAQFIDIEEEPAAATTPPSMMEMKSNKTFSSKMTRRNSGSLFSPEESQVVSLHGVPTTTKSDDVDEVDEETKNRNEKKFYDLERERMNKEYYDKKVQAAKETLAAPHDESLTPPSLKPPPIQTEEKTKPEPTRTEIPAVAASKLVQAVYDNPCAICLEAFVLESDDNIIFCSNVNTPHPFHQECSLDYLVSHVDGVAAPCPLCRQPFMYTQDHEEEAKGGAALPSFPSALSLASLLEAREEGAMISHPSSLSLKDLIDASEEKITISHPSSLSLTDLLRETAKADTSTNTTSTTTNKTKNSSVPLNIM